MIQCLAQDVFLIQSGTQEPERAFRSHPATAPLALEPASKDLLPAANVVTKSGKQISHFFSCLASTASDSTPFLPPLAQEPDRQFRVEESQ